MANTRLVEQRRQAEKLYKAGITSPTDIGETVGVRRQTVSKWIVEGKWEKNVALEKVTPEELADQLIQTLNEMLSDIKVKKQNKEVVSLHSLKEVIFLTRALKNISDEWDIRGSMLVFVKRFTEFIATLPSDKLPNKKEFVTQLREVMPLFMQHIEATA